MSKNRVANEKVGEAESKTLKKNFGGLKQKYKILNTQLKLEFHQPPQSYLRSNS